MRIVTSGRKGRLAKARDHENLIRMADGLPILETHRLTLRIAELDEVGKIVRYLVRNRAHLKPWEPFRDDQYFTERSWLGAPDRDQREARDGEGYRFRMLHSPPHPSGEGQAVGVAAEPPLNSECDPLPSLSQRERVHCGDYIGTISLRNIVSFPGYNATLGYSLDHAFEGRGLMRDGVEAVIRFGFEHLNLRRIEACYMPANVRSEKLLLGLGFQVEGLLRSSLEVDGKWEDHRICSLINHNWRRP